MKKPVDAKSINLLREMVVADFKIRYQGSVLGYLWSLMRPLGLFLILYIIFGKLLKLHGNIPHYSTYLLFGIMLWNFFTEATNFGLNSLVDHRDMIRKIYVPKAVIVAASIFSALINLVIMFAILVVLMIATGQHIQAGGIPITILLILELTLVATSLSFLLATLYVRYRDIKYIWELGLQAIFYLTPIIYAFSLVPEKYQKYLAISPLTQIIQGVRYHLLTHETLTSSAVLTSTWTKAMPAVIVIVLVLVSTLYFRARSLYLAEEM